MPGLEDTISQIEMEADLDDDPEGLFDNLRSSIVQLESLGVDDLGSELINTARQQIEQAIRKLEEQKEERDKENESDIYWSHIVTQEKSAPAPEARDASARSVFEDVDR